MAKILYKINGDASGFNAAMDKAVGKAEKLKKQTSLISPLTKRIASGAFLASAGSSAIGGIIDFGKSVVESLAKYEMFSASLRTLMHGDKQMAEVLSNQLVTLAAKTPFSLEDVQAGTKQLMAYGFGAGTVVKNLKTLGDVSAAVGAPLTDIVYLYGTLKTQGRAYQKDINQFTTRGIPIVEELAAQFGVTTDKVNELVKDGKVGFPEIEKAFTNMTKEGGRFFGMMDEQSKTVGGQLSNMGDAWDRLQVNIGKSQRGIIAGTVEMVNSLIGSFNKYYQNTNAMEKSFEKYGAIKYTDNEKDRIGTALGYSAKSKDIKYEDTIRKMYIEKSGENKLEAYKSKSSLSNLLANTYRDNEAKKDIGAFTRTVAMLKGAIEEVTGNIDFFNKSEADAAKTAEELKRQKEEEAKGKAAEAQKLAFGMEQGVTAPQNLYITINGGIAPDMTVSTTNLTESATEIKSKVAQALLEAVNDINNMIKK